MGERIPLPKKHSRIDPESFLNIPLFRQLHEDPQIKLVARSTDANWFYHGVIGESMAGFNPLQSAVYYPSVSQFAEWIQDPRRSARDFNQEDFLAREVLFLTHDYLHAWAYLAINELRPELGFGTRPITAANLDDFVFCHLLTEACATAGVDYWFLSCVSINSLCDVGTCWRNLTTPYQEQDLPEFRKFNPDLEVQSERFFGQLAQFYCTGVLYGFSPDDLLRSPKLTRWLRHELEYGEVQREYIRLWFSYLSHDKISLSADKLRAPLRLDKKWQRDLIIELGSLLWEKVKNGVTRRIGFAFDPDETWSAPRSKTKDYRFLNLNRVRPKAKEPLLGFESYFNQYISQFDFHDFDPEIRKDFPLILEKEDAALLHSVTKNMKRLSPAVSRDEPRDLFVLN
jgi:hypothetical protein